ncbi:MarR family transcriptional regulator [Flagellimonas sp. DF-77]|uniref:MarR family winged helix-turn-helix transcriptional regulator n=1 Tax=Flagellimonas algarum TaxID=3230298 RepID=UPI0033932661
MKYRLPDCIGSRIRRLSRIADAEMRKVLQAYGTTENQTTILFTLHELGNIEQGKIGEVLFLERSTVSRNIKLLEKRGLVHRSAAYRPMVELTEKGRHLVIDLIPKWEQAMDILTGKLKEEGLEHLQNLEQKLT